MNNTNSLNNYLIVFNPVANKKRQQIVNTVQQRLQQNNIQFELYPTAAELVINQTYFKQRISQYSDVIVIGGDGTLNCVINCLPDNSQIRLGLVPAGTGNDFARMWYGRDRNLNTILDIVTGISTQQISLGECIFNEANNENQYQIKRRFHNVMGTGFDSKLAKDLRHNKGRFPSLSYLMAAVKKVPFYQEKTSSFIIDDEKQQYENLITAFANGRYFGGGLKVAPKANPLSADLDIVQVARHPLLTKLKLIIALCVGKHMSAKQVQYRTIKSTSLIDTVGLDLQADGEYIGQSPCSISVIENAVKVKR